MITKGIVEEIITKYEVRVRIPIYHKIKGVQGATPTKDLPIAHTCVMFGICPNYKVGDIVYVTFENNQLQNVVILGYLYNDKNVESYPDMTVNSLNTISKLNGANIDGSVSGDVVTSVFNRSGDVQAKYGDYSIEQISATGSEGQVPMLNSNGRFIMGTPSAQLQADWTETDATQADFIQHKPNIPAQLSDLSEDSTHRTVSDTEKSSWNGKSNFSGDYTDLANKPTIPTKLSDLSSDDTHRTVSDTEKTLWDNKSDFSGSYTDLINKPSIPSCLSDLSADSTHRTVTDAEKTSWNNKSDFSGSYEDLTNKPSIPTTLAELSDDSTHRVVTDVEKGTWNNKSDFSGSYTDLSDKPTIPTKLSDLSADSTHRTVTDSEKSAWTNKSDFSGDYTDLTNKPDIPTKLSDLSSDSTHRIVTDTEKGIWNNKSDFSGSYNDLTNKPTIPSTTSELTNNSGFITKTVNNLTNYYTKTETYTQTEINELISQLSNLHFEVVETLPTHDIPTNVIFLLAKESESETDVYDEYIYINNNWELIGTTQVDLSSYVTIDDLNRELADYVLSSALATVATSGSYNDLTDKPTIPTVNNGTLTIQRNGTAVQTFKANQSNNVTANISVPTALSELSDNATHRLVTDTEKATWNNKSDFSGSYSDLTDKPTIPVVDSALSTTSTNAIQNKVITTEVNKKVNDKLAFTEATTRANIASGESFATILGKIKKFFSDLKAVAFSGSYNDLINKPTIPSTLADLTADSTHRTVTDAEKSSWSNKSTFSGSYTDLTNVPEDIVEDANYVHTDNNYTTVEKNKLSGIASGAEVNQNAFSTVKVGETSVSADSKTDTLTLVAGSNITITPDTTNDKITITAKDTTYSSKSAVSGGTDVSLVTTGEKYNWNVKVDDNPTFTEASTRANIISGETFSVLLGKIKKYFTDLKSVAFSGSYTDLTNKPTIPTALSDLTADSTHRGVTDTEKTAWNNKSDFSGSYDDLTDKPTIPAEQIQSDWNQTNSTKKDFIKNKPTIPTVNNAKLTIQRNGVAVQTFTANQGTDVTANISVPTSLSDLSADATHRLVTDTEKSTWNAKASTSVATTSANGLMSKDDKTKLDGIATGAEANVQSDWNETDSSKDSFIKNKPTIPTAQIQSNWTQTDDTKADFIKNKPTIPTVNNGTLTIQRNGTNVQTFTANQGTNVTANISVPTKTSDITNDRNYLENFRNSNGAVQYLNTHPENKPVLLPFINNDIAFLLKRGGSLDSVVDGEAVTIGGRNAMFDATPSYCSINPSCFGKPDYTTLVLELTLHKAFTWSNNVYIDFGAMGWRAKSVKIEVMNSNVSEDDWVTKLNVTNNAYGSVFTNLSHTPVGDTDARNGFNKIRFTLSDWNNATNRRIAQIGIVGYSSLGLNETCVTRDGGAIYEPLYPFSNNGTDLGKSDKKWANIYVTNINGSAYIKTDNNFTTTLKNKLDGIATGAEVNVQSDWNVTDNTSDAFIKNKPSIPTKLSDLTADATHRVVTDTEKSTWNGKASTSTATTSANGLMSKEDKTKLNGIATGADVSVQSDWNEVDSTSKAFIKNKPSLVTDVYSIGATAPTNTKLIWIDSSDSYSLKVYDTTSSRWIIPRARWN